eukprot:scpid49224/ scgid4419/ Golgin subfamily A member 1; Golgin-97
MFKKLKKKVAEDPTLGLPESSGKTTKGVLPSGPNVLNRPTKTIGLSSDDDQSTSESSLSPGSAIRIQASTPAKLEPDPSLASQKPGENAVETGGDSQAQCEPTISSPTTKSEDSTLELQEQLKYLQQRLTTAEASESAAYLEREHSERQLAELRKQVGDLSSLVAEHQNKFQTCNEDLSANRLALRDREATIDELRGESSRLSEKLSTEESRHQRASDELSRLTIRLKELEERLTTTDERLKAICLERDELRTTLDSERQDAVLKRRDLLTAQEQCRQLQGQLSSQQNLHSEEVAGLRDRLSTIGQQLADSDHPEGSQVAALAAERDDVEKRLSEARKLLADQQAASDEKLGKLEILNEEKDTELMQLHQKLEDVEQSLQAHVTLVSELRDELKSSQHQQELTQNDNAVQLAALSSQLKEAQERSWHAEEELQQLKDRSENNLTENETRIDELSEQLAKAREQLADSMMKSSSLVSELENQLGQLQTARDIDKATADSKLGTLRQECSELRQNLADNRRLVSASAKERAFLDADLTVAVTSIQTRNQSLMAFGREIEYTVDSDLAESSLYSDEDGKLRHSMLDKWRDEQRKFLEFAQASLSTERSKRHDQEEDSRRLVNSLELEQYATRQLREELTSAKTSLEELSSTSNHDAAVLNPSSNSNGVSHVPIDTTDATRSALMDQTTSSDAMAELAELHQKVARMEEDMAEKNQTVKQQQQLLGDLRKQLQRHVGKPVSAKLHPVSSADLSPPHGSMSSQKLDPVNDLYLKNVILRYMCSTDWEAQHLIKAVSTLLRFTSQEEKLVRDYFAYKTSWFGAKPGQPPS